MIIRIYGEFENSACTASITLVSWVCSRATTKGNYVYGFLYIVHASLFDMLGWALFPVRNGKVAQTLDEVRGLKR